MFEARKLYLQRSEISPLWETNISTRFFFFLFFYKRFFDLFNSTSESTKD